MPYIKIYKNGKRKFLENAPKYYHDGGAPVSDEWLIKHENIYPLVDQNISEETDVISIIEKPIKDWIINKNNVVKSCWIVINEPIVDKYDEFYQSLDLNDESKWIKDDKYIYRTFSVSTKDIETVKNDLKRELKEKRKRIETGGLRYYFKQEQEKYYKIQTDTDSQLKLSKYFMLLELFEDVNWKTFDEFITLTPENIKDLFSTIQFFVKSCFDNEKRILYLIESTSNYEELKTVYNDEFNIGWNPYSMYLMGE